ncbi:type II pantothenate kinase [Solibacillus kalamii]|uniref:Pantothenate kinase, acetyl-CoA regulated n=2 Tax=Solibacillus TaxID=648800 RepID=F2F5V2_SOLSS|nr:MULTISPECIES: type II pantothenate kinase [Solibacillus]MBM7667070.1 type II pantothenate kinase [Solibacillus kalamii]MCM3721802.1 type II pantothenate kinase [Solibacillus isronensis]OBW55966.1 type II pantothenate kinase [Solibacillus silvestris]OUZ38215.1 type II pantothenate kinase [Solibacillus kalamii]BAK17035.1 pantothenate kinase, acetyl-CoA regulated [Solibacillus silvestris StLB046]
MSAWIGIDTGGTLTKLAYLDERQELKLTVFPSNEMHLVKEWLENHPQVEEIGLTGGRTEQLLDVLKTMKSIEYIVEFEATLKGVRYLLEKEGHTIDQSIITNIGTGTSIHYMDGNTHARVGGTGVGGGTLIGLSTIMTGISDFDEIKANAFKGKREGIDLLVKDIYQGMDTPIDGNLTASNFGKVGITDQREFEQNNVLATTQGLIGEVISTLSIQLAVQHETEHIVYIGSTLIDNEQLVKVIEHYTILKKHKPIFLEDCGFSGAIGALLNIREHSRK